MTNEEYGRAVQHAPTAETKDTAANAFWEHLYRKGAHKVLARAWIKRRSKAVMNLGLSRDEIEAEVLWVIRRVIYRWDPDYGVRKSRFETYAFLTVMSILDDWADDFVVPVKIPRAIRRQGDVLKRFESLDTKSRDQTVADDDDPGVEEPGELDPLITYLESEWTRELEDNVEWQILCADRERVIKL